MFSNLKLNIARKLVSSLLVDVRKHPEKLIHYSNGSVKCEQNLQVAKAFEAIDKLKKEDS